VSEAVVEEASFGRVPRGENAVDAPRELFSERKAVRDARGVLARTISQRDRLLESELSLRQETPRGLEPGLLAAVLAGELEQAPKGVFSIVDVVDVAPEIGGVAGRTSAFAPSM
jgi:hypothetical protein